LTPWRRQIECAAVRILANAEITWALIESDSSGSIIVGANLSDTGPPSW